MCLNKKLDQARVKKSFEEAEMFKKSVGILTAAFFVVGALALWADTANVAGDWELTVQTPRGEMTSPLNFVQEGEVLTVKTQGFQGDELTGSGKIKDNEIEWTISVSTPRGDFTMTYKGKVDGETMTGTVEFGQMGSSDWTAKKVKK
jgi:hypothetical protein